MRASVASRPFLARNEFSCNISRPQRLLVAILLSGVAAISVPRAAHAVEILTGSGWSVNTRGFVTMDVNWDQHDIGAAEPLLPAPDGSRQADNRALRFSASQSQIGFFLPAAAPHGIFKDWRPPEGLL